MPPYQRKDPAEVSAARSKAGKAAAHHLRHDAAHQARASKRALVVRCPQCGIEIDRKKARKDMDAPRVKELFQEHRAAAWLEAYCIGRELLDLGFGKDDVLQELRVDGRQKRAAAWTGILTQKVVPTVGGESLQLLPPTVAPMVGEPDRCHQRHDAHAASSSRSGREGAFLSGCRSGVQRCLWRVAWVIAIPRLPVMGGSIRTGEEARSFRKRFLAARPGYLCQELRVLFATGL